MRLNQIWYRRARIIFSRIESNGRKIDVHFQNGSSVAVIVSKSSKDETYLIALSYVWTLSNTNPIGYYCRFFDTFNSCSGYLRTAP
jgi:hypothetical protein